MTDAAPLRLNPSICWFAAYLVATITGTLVASLGTALVASEPGQGSLFGLWATRILPFSIALLFVPAALCTFLLHKLGLWNLPAFAGAGAAMPAVFLALLFAMTSGAGPGENFVPLLIVWAIAGAIVGTTFHQTFERLR